MVDQLNKIKKLKGIIEYAYESNLNVLKEKNQTDLTEIANVKFAIRDVLQLLNCGKLRVAEKIGGKWIVHQWLKKAILLAFRIMDNKIIKWGDRCFFDKIPEKFFLWKSEDFQKDNLRVVPPATVRYGAYIASNVVLMPSFVNIGAYIDEGSMIDTWVTVGSCAQIGKNVHLSGGVGIGGVLEPLHDYPTIIENNCFIGARSEIVEGVVIEQGSVISMGVFIGQSTKIYDCQTGNISYGRIPSGSVVVPGTLPYAKDKYSKLDLYCVAIIKKVDAKTRSKVGINELLRN